MASTRVQLAAAGATNTIAVIVVAGRAKATVQDRLLAMRKASCACHGAPHPDAPRPPSPARPARREGDLL
jgi:hypothetical protein